ncbi:DUF1579 family protein [Modestobacter marinus]|uniref:DUF1579 family protein n=1 Tax=Modestobacter marinus TaxID=477641 RepID=UPI001C9487CB|nr:DUF1579 family protein [Modestobacter marinus]
MSAADPQHPFAALLGRWQTTGTVLDDAGAPAVAVEGTDEYELMVGDRWVVHRVDVRLGPDRARALELIGDHDPQARTWAMHAFDADGSYSLMRASRRPDGSWLFAADEVRAGLRVHADGRSMSATWERWMPPDRWLRWMDLRFERQNVCQPTG